MLDDFREWLSDNLRYILLGLAAILLIVAAFFAVRLIKGIGSPKEKEPETQQESTESVTEAKDAASENPLVRESADSKVLSLVMEYYNAVAAKDYDTLASICESFTEEDKTDIEQNSAVEQYTDITAYTKKGLKDGEYIVYAYMKAKLTGIETQVPCLKELYFVTDAEGKLAVGDVGSSQELINYRLEMQADQDVQALMQDVAQLLETAKSQDQAVADYVNGVNQGNAEAGEHSENAGDGGDAAATGTMQATTTVNVRESASADSVLYGILTPGQQVEVLESGEDGWSKIRFTTSGTTIEGYVMTQYLGPVS